MAETEFTATAEGDFYHKKIPAPWNIGGCFYAPIAVHVSNVSKLPEPVMVGNMHKFALPGGLFFLAKAHKRAV